MNRDDPYIALTVAHVQGLCDLDRHMNHPKGLIPDPEPAQSELLFRKDCQYSIRLGVGFASRSCGNKYQ